MTPAQAVAYVVGVHVLASIGAATVFGWLCDLAARAIRASRLRRGMSYTWRRAWQRAGDAQS